VATTVAKVTDVSGAGAPDPDDDELAFDPPELHAASVAAVKSATVTIEPARNR
jgi:hypothetical protein